MIILLWIFATVAVFLISINMYIRVAPQFGKRPDKQEMAAKAINSVYIDEKFQNQNKIPTLLPGSYGKLMRLVFAKNPGRVPETPIPSVAPEFGEKAGTGDVSVIWLGHSSVLIKIENTIMLTDPVFSKRASPVSFFGPKQFNYTISFTPENTPYPDIILISHDHFDHLDYRIIKRYYSGVKTFIVPLGIKSHLVRWGVPELSITELDWWDQKDYNKELSFIATPAQHFSGRQGQNNSSLWCSWVIRGENGNIFYCGDSGYSTHFREIGEKYGPFDLTLMESGAYGKYWPYIHMLPEESVRAYTDLRGKVLLPIHWGKFNLAFHSWKEPVERIWQEALKKGIDLVVPVPGQEYKLGMGIEKSMWWKKID